MKWDPNKPYTELPALPPIENLDTVPILKKCITSRAAVAAVNEASDHLPSKELLINIVPVLEAQGSSEIENIVTTTDRIFRGSSVREEATDPATKEAANYRRALYQGFQSMVERPLCTATAETVCSVIKQTDMRVRTVPGTALQNDKTGDVIYTPPVGDDLLREKLANWERFLHDPGDLDPLVVMAVAHYQFEAIHPFTDGNGRTGRVLNLLYLIHAGLLKAPILYLSHGILARREEYYENLNVVTRTRDWEAWVIFMLEVVEMSARWTSAKIYAIREFREETKERFHTELPKLYSTELLDILFAQPYCRIGHLVDAGIAKRQSASVYLKQLVSAGFLEEEKVGREKLFVNRAFLSLLAEEGKV